MPQIQRAAILGAGVMGSAIAAHLANAGIPSLLLDIVPADLSGQEGEKDVGGAEKELRNRIAAEGLQKALKASPAAFGHRARARWVAVGNLADDLDKIAETDWVIEAIVEDLAIKRSLFARVVPHLKTSALLTSNTSGLSVEELSSALPPDLRRRFFGTHFFNPPRYMHLLEVVPGRDTDVSLLSDFVRFAERKLGKGVVLAKDTPNFVANRIGVFSFLHAAHAMEKHGLSVEVADALTGRALGRPKTATFGTADLVGLDVLAKVAATQYAGVPNDECRDLFALPLWIETMVQKGLLGKKSGAGFYKSSVEKGEKHTLALDPGTLDYRMFRRPEFPVLAELSNLEEPGERIARLVADKTQAGRFAWDVVAGTLLYAARRIPEVADDITALDRAMRWGFGWELGPFEVWDALGVQSSVARMLSEGMDVPPAVLALAESSLPRSYSVEGIETTLWDLPRRVRTPLGQRPRVIVLSDLKRTARLLYSNREATLVDLGDGVACLEFHSKMNSIGGGIVQAIVHTLAEAGVAFGALVIGNQGENFSVGANLALLLFEALEGNLPEIEAMVRAFQRATTSLKYAPVPVVAAPFGRVLGGGLEICLHSHRVQAGHEAYMGLVEAGVGLLPAGGGSKELLLRAMTCFPEGTGADPFPFVRRAFETISLARVSTSAWEAFDLGYLREGDGVTMNPEHLIHDAKRAALDLLETGWQPLHGPATVSATGRDGLADIRSMLHTLKAGRQISEHDAVVAERIGRVLCGGEVDGGTVVTEDYLLDLERRAFLELCGERKTLERIRHTLKTGKPLRN